MKLFWVLVPVTGWLLWQLALPLDQYTSRSWDALFLGSNKLAPFYPSQSFEMPESGDLAIHGPHAIFKKLRFTTDQWGYRNDSSVCADPDAVIIGDSMAVGGGLSQEDTPSMQLSNVTGKCVRSFAGGSMNFALQTIYGLKLKPRVVFLVLTQRTAGALKPFSDVSAGPLLGAHTSPLLNRLLLFFVNLRKNYFSNYRFQHGVINSIRRTFMSPPQLSEMRQENANLSHDSQMLFYPDDWKRVVSLESLKTDAEILEQLSNRLSKMNARLVVTFVPNKSTIYPGEFIDQDPDLIRKLDQSFQGYSFEWVDLFTQFRAEYSKDGTLNHHLDDTHWNAHGVKTWANLVKTKGML